MATHILTDITQQFHNATGTWHAYLFPIANTLFGTLAVIEIAWAGIWWGLEKQDVSSLWVEMLKKFVSLGLFYSILLYSSTWIPAVLNSFIKIGAGASGHSQLYPSDVIDQGVSIATNIFKTFHDTGIFSFGLSTIVGAFAGLTVLLSFALIAGLLVVTLVESYIVLGAGILMLGFASNRVSSKFATNYFSYAMSVGVKLFMLYLILGIGGSLADGWITMFSNLSTVEISPFLEVAGGAIVYLFCAWAIPHKAESLMSGSTNATLGGLVAAVAVGNAAARMATGAATGVTKALMGAGSSGMEAMKQAHSVKQGSGLGLVGYAVGAVAAGANLASSALGSASGRHSSTSGAMKQKTAGVKSFFAERAEKQAANQTIGERPTQTSPPVTPSSNNTGGGNNKTPPPQSPVKSS